MSLSDEKEWFKKHVSGDLGDSLRAIKDVVDRLGRAENGVGGANAQNVVIATRLDSAVTQLTNAGSAWESHNEKLVQSAAELQQNNTMVAEIRGLLEQRTTDLQEARNSADEKIEAEKKLVSRETALEMERLKNEVLTAQRELQETKTELQAANTASSERDERHTRLQERYSSLQTLHSEDERKLRAAEARVLEQDIRISELVGGQQQLENERSAAKTKHLEAEERLRSSEAKATDLEQKLRSAETEIAQLKGKSTSDDKSITVLMRSLAHAQGERDESRQNAGTLTNEKHGVEEELKALRVVCERWCDRAKVAETNLGTARQDITELQSELRDSGLAISATRARVLRLEGENDILDRRADEAEAREEQLRSASRNDILNSINEFKSRSYQHWERLDKDLADVRTQELSLDVQRMAGSIRNAQSSSEVSLASIKSMINRLSDKIEERSESSPRRALKRRRIDSVSSGDEEVEEP